MPQNVSAKKTPLTDLAIKALKSCEKQYRVYDAKGLYLQINPTGSKLWRYKYQFQGKEKLLSLGPYPEVTLAEARELRDEARKILRSGDDPGAIKKQQKAVASASNTFQAVAEEWLQIKAPGWSASHLVDNTQRLNNHVFPFVGNHEISEITPMAILEVIRRLETRNTPELARKVLMCCSQVFRYAVTIGKASSDPCRDLKGVLKPHKPKSHPSVTAPDEIGDLLLTIDNYRGRSTLTKQAIKFSALTFCRPGEIRAATWSEIDWGKEIWLIPAERMKNKENHKVPLSRQALEILINLKPITGNSTYIFPGFLRNYKPMSEATVTNALKKMGYKDKMVAHGFRAMASTCLNELGYRPDIIEAQLSHKEADKTRAAYNRAQYMEERQQLMQDWADYLDKLLAEAQKRNKQK